MAYIGKQPLVGNYQVLDAITASATATYALTKNSVAVFPQTPANCIVSLNGVIQAPFDSYTISGSNIVFASALTGSDSIDFITVLGDVLNVGTVSDNTITTAKLADSSVSLAKLTATGTKDATTFLRGDNTFASAGGANTPAFAAERTSTVSVSGATNTEITYPTEIFDNGSCYNTSTGRFTPTTAGNYLITATMKISSLNSGDEGYLQIRKNGNYLSSEPGQKELSGASGFDAILSASVIFNFNGTTDYASIWCYHSAGGAKSVLGNFGAIKIIE
jgi:hypothetical protein